MEEMGEEAGEEEIAEKMRSPWKYSENSANTERKLLLTWFQSELRQYTKFLIPILSLIIAGGIYIRRITEDLGL